MEFNHKPVLLEECIEGLQIKPDGIYMDGTLGGAGHSMEIYKKLGKEGLLIGSDQDSFALEISKERLSQLNGQANFILANRNFKYLKEVCLENKIESVDGILLDLGVSSHQLDESERGFSYQKDALLDMRMDRSGSVTAGTIVNEYDKKKLRDIIRDFSEEKWAARIAEFIIEARKEKKIETTTELVDIIKAAIPSAARRDGPHPAKRTFQALRIEVNNELGILDEAITRGIEILKPHGRLCIITFHSLEDRIVKNVFQRHVNPCMCPKQLPMCVCGKKPSVALVTRKPIVASDKELDENPRSRSAKLRIIEKV